MIKPSIKPSQVFREAIKKGILQYKGWWSNPSMTTFCAAGLFKDWKAMPDWRDYVDLINKTLSKGKGKQFDMFTENDRGWTFEQFAQELERHGR